MKTIKLILATTLAAASGLALADYNGSRDDRMQSALDNYHRSHMASGDSRNPSPGPAARAENSVKRGAHNTGQAIKHGAQRVGHAVGNGLRKTGDAMGHAVQKLGAKGTDVKGRTGVKSGEQ